MAVDQHRMGWIDSYARKTNNLRVSLATKKGSIRWAINWNWADLPRNRKLLVSCALLVLEQGENPQLLARNLEQVDRTLLPYSMFHYHTRSMNWKMRSSMIHEFKLFEYNRNRTHNGLPPSQGTEATTLHTTNFPKFAPFDRSWSWMRSNLEFLNAPQSLELVLCIKSKSFFLQNLHDLGNSQYY